MIEWGLDTTGQWTEMQIELKTGDNFDMVDLMRANPSPGCNVAQHAHKNLVVITTIDATKETKYTYTCPQVCPSAKCVYC